MIMIDRKEGPEGSERKTFIIETQCESMAINENWGE
jgi:hypothetical protein